MMVRDKRAAARMGWTMTRVELRREILRALAGKRAANARGDYATAHAYSDELAYLYWELENAKR